MAKISALVGSYESGAKNIPADVETVQRQRKVGMVRPDQRIDVGGKTWTTLVGVAGPVVAVPPKAVAGTVTLTVKHGGKIPTQMASKVPTTATHTGLYESTFTLSGGLSGVFKGSIWPDNMTIKGHLVDGEYPLHIGFHKGGGAGKQTASDLTVKTKGTRPGLLVNARSAVTVKSDNATKTASSGINVHNGFNSKRWSDGCLTIQPSDWSRFIQLFLDAFPNIADRHTVGNNTGKKIGKLVIKQ